MLSLMTAAFIAGSSLEAAPASIAPQSYEVDAVHSSVVFGIRHAGVANFYGMFESISGSFTWDDASPSASSFQFEIPLDSVDTNNDSRDNHVKSADFFNVRQYPSASFKSTGVAKKGDAFELTGDLTFHGVTKSITADLEMFDEGQVRGATKRGFEARFSFKRSDFKMTEYLAPDGGEGGGLGNTIRVIVAVEAGRS